MKLPTGSPARRLVVASTSAVVFHAAMFGVIEWNLSQHESAGLEEAPQLSVTVTMQEPAPPPEDSRSLPQEVDNGVEPSEPVESTEPAEQAEEPTREEMTTTRERPDLASRAHTISTAAQEVLTDRNALHDSESTEPAESTTPAESVADGDMTDATPPTVPAIPAALQRSINTPPSTPPAPQPTAPSRTARPTLEPARYTPPRYPETARRRGLTGTVVLEATIGNRGRVTTVHILNSSGVDSLDRAATRAVRTWRFARGTQEQTSVHHIRFDLEETQ